MKRLRIILFTIILPVFAVGQTQNNFTKKDKQVHAATKLPSWAAAHDYDATAHAYFPDYYTFYDPKRGGYVFWENGKWTFSPAEPPFLQKADLSKSRIQILKGLSLDLYPELDYPYYMKMYPPDNNGNTLVPAPIPGNPAAPGQ